MPDVLHNVELRSSNSLRDRQGYLSASSLPTSTSVGQWIAPSDDRESCLDIIALLLTDESLWPCVIHHFEYRSFQRHVVVPRLMHEQRP